ncbi:GNAT family N-acetyltransferase [Chakrabartyella piscis]|uniref:GNAT family N-acetyltransferase n=1 Tax=Chakrabartyella piscis TaxID=2918914 RepID=UPI002958D9CE|nr:GNAT family N-acetyltransferase [Chakrabartyella piscis]
MNEKLTLRLATVADAPRILEIYTPYVTDTEITFEFEIPTISEFERRISTTLEKFPYYVAELNGVVVGYSYASLFRSRAAYGWTVESSVYLDEAYTGRGIGALLMFKLEDTLQKQGIETVIACITHPNEASIALHEKLRYTTVGHFTKCGFKNGVWKDVVWMEKHLSAQTSEPKKFIPFQEL